MAANRCPQCRCVFQTMEDEWGEHACPYCGYETEQEADRRMDAQDVLKEIRQGKEEDATDV